MSEYQFLKLNVQHKVGVITIDKPPVNALNLDVLKELDQMLDEVVAGGEVKALVITGAGQQVFVAGADINTFNELGSLGDPAAVMKAATDYLKTGQDIFMKLDQLPIPTIAAINGAALGGGLELVLACDIRIAADNARLGFPEINLGIMPGWGGTQRLPRLIGESRAYELIMTGDNIPAPQALQMGLLNKVVPAQQLMREAQGMARKIAEKSRIAIQGALQAIPSASELPLQEGMAIELKQFETLIASADFREGVSAFVEKRKPEFKDK